MDTLDQLDDFVANNSTLLQHVIVFIVSVSLVLVICVLIYSMLTGNKVLKESEAIQLRLNERINDLRALQAIQSKQTNMVKT